MNQWTPITKTELLKEMQKTESELQGETWNFWQLIKVEPEKWSEPEYGEEGNGFWVVGICGKRIIWYNDIEDGFNISTYKDYGEINEYNCSQDELSWTVNRLYKLMKFGGQLTGQRGPAEPLE